MEPSTGILDADARVWDRARGCEAACEIANASTVMAGCYRDELLRVLRRLFNAPDHMHVRAQQQQVALVERVQGLPGNIEHGQWCAPATMTWVSTLRGSSYIASVRLNVYAPRFLEEFVADPK